MLEIQGFADIMMLEVDGLFYLVILNFRWKWSSIICRYWLNRLKYITYEELTHTCSLFDYLGDMLEIHYLWGIDTTLFYSYRLYIQEIHYLWGIDTSNHIIYNEFIIRDTLPMRNWHVFDQVFWSSCIEIHYLWGIDTSTDSSQRTLKREIHYLWGIDTSL